MSGSIVKSLICRSLGFIGTTTQWLFNKRRIFARRGETHPAYLSFVISGARKLVESSSDGILEIVLNDLHAMIPASREARVVKSLVLKEKKRDDGAGPALARFAADRRDADSEFLSGRRLDTNRPSGDD